MTQPLQEALAARLTGYPEASLVTSVRRLIDRYRDGAPAEAPILASPVDVAAYAAYRMPATYAAVLEALEQAVRADPGLRPVSQLDVGGGTGAAAWAAAAVFPSLARVTVVDHVAAALDLGAAIGAPVPDTRWHELTLGPRVTLPAADLVTISYVLGELPADGQAALVAAGLAAGETLVVVEPGTPGGYRRVLAAREQLVAAGRTVVAPCPHQGRCPLAGGDDWCHFAARVNRTALHRRLKDATLGHEDEKFSYVVATHAAPPAPRPGRVLRHPRQRKGLVSLRVCTPEEGTATETVVSRRHGPLYRAARRVRWGDPWPPASEVGDGEDGDAGAEGGEPGRG